MVFPDAMADRLLPPDDPVAEEVLEWTIERDSEDVVQLMGWLVDSSSRRERRVLINRALDLLDEIRHALVRLDELR